MIQNFSNRTFQLWEYKVSHGQLLIRSPKSEKNQTNVDIAFAGVEYIAIPTLFEDFSLVEPNDTESNFLTEFKTENYSPQIFVFETKGNRYLIVAAGAKIFENTLDIFESSLEKF